MKFLFSAVLAGSAAANYLNHSVTDSALNHTVAEIARNHSIIDSARCCNELKNTALGSKVLFPSNPNYEASVESYWSVTARLAPACFVLPTTAQDVSLTVKTLVKSNSAGPCRFAIRGGGHTPWPGAANIKDGVTIDLSSMNKVIYDKEKSMASIGPGARWTKVFEVLEPLGVAVPGGRNGAVGVGGFTLGGGNSFFAARYGWACDNVANFEVVLGDGCIVNANKTSNPELFKGLKGGGNNLGIVTRFDLYAFAQGDLWGGVVVYPESTTPQQIPAFVSFGNNIAKDEYGSLISSWQYGSETNATSVANFYTYTKPVANAAPFAEHLRIPGKIVDTMRITNLTGLLRELREPVGFRNSFSTLTFANDPRVFQKAIDVFRSSVESERKSAVGKFDISTVFQPLPRVFFKHGVERGGNILGLDGAKENLILYNIYIYWLDAKDDGLFDHLAHDMICQIRQYAQSIDKANEFIYLNYASDKQNPLRSYGAENLRMLREVARKYDPQAVFQTLVPGGFKLDEAGQA